MILREVLEPFPDVIFRQQHDRDDSRPHVSTILRDIENEIGNRKTQPTWDMDVAAQVGVLFEVALGKAYQDLFADPVGELELDGIVGNPDGLDIGWWGIEEFKVTWRSSNKTPEDNWYYKCQAMAYCKMLGTKRCRWRILYLNGDYKGSGPQYRVYEAEFGDMELEENWSMIVNHARHKGWVA